MSTLGIGKLDKLLWAVQDSCKIPFMGLITSVLMPYLWKSMLLVAALHFCSTAELLPAVSLAITVQEQRNEHLNFYSVIYFEIVRNSTKVFYFRCQTFFKFVSALN